MFFFKSDTAIEPNSAGTGVNGERVHCSVRDLHVPVPEVFLMCVRTDESKRTKTS